MEKFDNYANSGLNFFCEGISVRDIEGRPFPPEEAAACFGRIKAGGVNFIRYRLPLTALEPGGVQGYDEEHLAYLRKIFLGADAAGLSVIVDSGGAGPADIPRTQEDQDRFLNALRHAYRRLKNCKAITGWAIPKDAGTDFPARFAERMREVNPQLRVFTV
jgi:hypothetical protein